MSDRFSQFELLSIVGALARAAGIGSLYVNGGNISEKESARNALADMANDWERRLLGLHCGQMLDRRRHVAWADRQLIGAKYLVGSERGVGVVIRRAA